MIYVSDAGRVRRIGNGKRESGMPNRAVPWQESYLDEDGIVADILAKVRADPEAVKMWLDDDSWHMPMSMDGMLDKPSAGALMFAGMSIRNWDGLWHPECPYTKNTGDLEIKDGVVTDPKFADNLSERVIDRVRSALGYVGPQPMTEDELLAGLQDIIDGKR